MTGQTGQKKYTPWRIIILGALALVCSAFGSRFHGLIAGNDEAINMIVTIFSILAGFLAAVIGLVAETFLSQATSWHELRIAKNSVIDRLLRQQMMFFVYLLTLGAAGVLHLMPDSPSTARSWAEGIFLSLSLFSFFISFTLPSTLLNLQVERYEMKMRSIEPPIVGKLRHNQQTAQRHAEE